MTAERALLFSLLACTGCEVGDQPEPSRCEAEATVSGRIVEGNQVTEGVPLPQPLKVSVRITADVPIAAVRIGDPTGHFIPAQLVSVPDGRWEASLFPADLEHFRPEGSLTATVPVDAVELCGEEHAIGQLTVALGPKLGVPVEDLAIAPQDPLPDCYVPADGAVAPSFEITAARSAIGARVQAVGTRGTWSNGMATMELTLADGGDAARAWSRFTPSMPGVAVIQAVSGGVSSEESYQLVIAGPPQVTASTTTPLRNATAWLDFSTAGNFASCDIAESFPGTVTARLISPREADIDGTVDVREASPSCSLPEQVRIAISFGAATPDGAAVTVRCLESSYGRFASTTLTVLTPEPPDEP